MSPITHRFNRHLRFLRGCVAAAMCASARLRASILPPSLRSLPSCFHQHSPNAKHETCNPSWTLNLRHKSNEDSKIDITTSKRPSPNPKRCQFLRAKKQHTNAESASSPWVLTVCEAGTPGSAHKYLPRVSTRCISGQRWSVIGHSCSSMSVAARSASRCGLQLWEHRKGKYILPCSCGGVTSGACGSFGYANNT